MLAIVPLLPISEDIGGIENIIIIILFKILATRVNPKTSDGGSSHARAANQRELNGTTTNKKLTFRMKPERLDDALMFDETDHTVSGDNSIAEYASDEGGILMEVKGPLLTTQSTVK